MEPQLRSPHRLPLRFRSGGRCLFGKDQDLRVSLGVTFVLFAGILMGHFGFTGDTHILHFIREFGLILFVFCIGLQVGPSFFSSFKKGGMTLNMLAVGIVVLNIAVAMALYFILGGRIELPHDGRYPVRRSHKHPGTPVPHKKH